MTESTSTSATDHTISGCTRCGGPLHGNTTGICPTCTGNSGSPTAPVEKPLEPGSMFHGLRIEGVLGRGGMGIVYKAVQPQLERTVALKILPAALASDQEFAARFVREGKALAALTHPNIVAIFDFGQDEGRHFLTMEYVDGTNLRTAMKAKTLTAAQALAIVPQVCDALHFAHSEGIVHRDIKPENILIDKKGRVKIADFGLAKMLSQDVRLENLTVTNVVMGTPNYMAPEQFERPKDVDHRVDLYSLGVMMYEMLTAELPVGRFDPPSKRVQVDVRLDDVVMRALEKQVEKRYQNASQIRDDVTKITLTAPAPPAEKKLSGVVFVIAAVAIVSLGLIVLLIQGPKLPPHADPPNPPVVVAPPPPPAPPKAIDLFAVSAIQKDDFQGDWRASDPSRIVEDRTVITDQATHLAFADQVKHIEQYRVEAFASDSLKQNLWVKTFRFKESEFLDAAVKTHRAAWRGDFSVIAHKTLLVILESDGRGGRLEPVVERLEDRIRGRMKADPVNRPGPNPLVAQDLPEGWECDAKATVRDDEKVRKALDAWPQFPGDEFRDGEVASYGPKGAPPSVKIVAVRFFEADKGKVFGKYARTAGEPAGVVRQEVMVNYGHVVLALLLSKDIKQSQGFDDLVKHLAPRVGRYSQDTEIDTNPIGCAITTKSIDFAFQLRGVSIRELSESGTWKMDYYLYRSDTVKVEMPTPTLNIEKGIIRVAVTIPVDEAVKRSLELLPSQLTVKIEYDRNPKTRNIEVKYDFKEEAIPAEFQHGLGSLLLEGKDAPTGWTIWHHDRDTGLYYPTFANSETEITQFVTEFAEVVKIPPAAVRNAAMYSLGHEGKEKLQDFDYVRIYLMHFCDADAQAAAIKALSSAKELPGADRFQVISNGAFVGVVAVRGSNATAGKAYDKLIPVVKRKLGVKE